MGRILIVDDDGTSVEKVATVLRQSAHEVLTTSHGRDAVILAEAFQPQLVLVELELPDVSGFDVLRGLRRLKTAPACAVVCVSGTVQRAVEAMRLGALDFIEKPLLEEVVLSLLGRTLNQCPEVGLTSLGDAELHSLTRWADLVVRISESPKDPRTLEDWGRSLGVSVGALRNWCRTAQLSSRRSLLLARVLRAIVRQRVHSRQPEDLLDVADLRTLAKLIRLSGGREGKFPSSLRDFLRQQQFIERVEAVEVLRRTLSAHGLDASNELAT